MSTDTLTADPHAPAAAGSPSSDADRGGDAREDWRIAGDAWSHAAADWAYRFEPHTRDAVEHILATTGVGDGDSLLDIACGSGYLLGVAARRGIDVHGLDAAEGLIEIAGRRAPDADLVVGTMFDLPWADASFDLVTSINGVWGGCQGALDEAGRVLRPGGQVALTFWGPGHALQLRDYFIAVGSTAPGVAEELIGLAEIGRPGVCENMLATAGFEVTERGATDGVLEFTDDDDAWRVLRSPGVVLPSIEHVGDDELRSRVLDAIAPYRCSDGSYRVVNEVTHVVGRKVD